MKARPNITMCMWKSIAMLLTAAALAIGIMMPGLTHASIIPFLPTKALENPIQLRPGERDILLVLARKMIDHSNQRNERDDSTQLNRTISSLRTLMTSTEYTYHDIIYLQRYGVNLDNLTKKCPLTAIIEKRRLLII